MRDIKIHFRRTLWQPLIRAAPSADAVEDRAPPFEAILTVERRALLLVVVALAYAQWGKPQQAYTSLITAERAAPGEVRTRNTVRRLVTDLSRSPSPRALPGLPALAARVHAAI